MRRVEAEWRDYIATVGLADDRQLRRAFMGGLGYLYQLLDEGTLNDPTVRMEIEAELTDFRNQVREGRA